MKNKKRNKYLLLLILLLGITLGYATLATTLKINGSATITKNNWSVYWTNPQVTEGSVNASTNIPSIGQDTNDPVNTKVTWSTTLNLPGDFYEFTVDAVNNGSIDAMITGITPTVTPALEDYIKYTVTYADGKPILEKHLLPKKTGNTATVQTYKVRIEFLDTITPTQMNAIPEGGLSYTLSYEVTYSQADDTAFAKAGTLQGDSWDTIVGNVRQDKSVYAVGETKTFEMDFDGDETNETYTLRVANNTTPAECSTTGFSQTACGFVLEFTQVITTHRMNPLPSGTNVGTGNNGGWESSDMRAYINSEKYLEGTENEINYATTGVYDKLPSEIKNAIINTTVVSGYGSNNSSNFTTTDKLYLLSTHEVWEDVSGTTTGIDDRDSAYSNTRQLDYYKSQGVTTSNYSAAAKQKMSGSNSYWWLRSAFSNVTNYFYYVGNDGYCSISNSDYSYGVSPAFRIAE